VVEEAGSGVLAAFEVEKGFNGAFDAEPEENGFANGFEGLALAPGLLTPKSDAPILVCGAFFSLSCVLDGSGACAFFSSLTLVTLVPRIPLTLPSFLRHAFRRQLKTYSRRSWPWKCSGRSPLSSRRSDKSELQTLHFARAPDGAVVSSNQACGLLADGLT
jgi:hypothetical protein